MRNQDLKSENLDTHFKEFFEFTGPIKLRRKSFLIALELFAIFAFCFIFWQAGLGSLGEATEIFLGLYFAEFCSVAINKNPLSRNIFIELPKLVYSISKNIFIDLPKFIYSIYCSYKQSNAEKNAETKPLIGEKNTKEASTSTDAEKNAEKAPTSTYGTIPKTISQTPTHSSGINNSLPENQLSLSIMPTIPSSSTESSSYTIHIAAEKDEKPQVSGDNKLIITFSG